ncbi:hypothetical protein BKA66DRAFT_610062 [Pyrenochaeta sp. MPI-SDFR-AT-0127]|nr:hypothetical protein BKA66DRAFT_610062 [Pyrenochaeta sp. MPI-SDFR-AT-0127]
MARPTLLSMYIFFLCLLFAIAQLSANIALGVKLLRVGDKILCKDPQGIMDEVMYLPVTFANQEAEMTKRGEYLSVHENKTISEILFASVATPLIILLAIMTKIAMHFCCLSNRSGILFALCLVGLFMTANVQDYWLNIDAESFHVEYNWCWTSAAAMAQLSKERSDREALVQIGGLLSGMGALFMALYLLLACLAVIGDNVDRREQSTRLQDLRNNNNRGDNSHASNTYTTAVPSPHLSPSSSRGASSPGTSSSGTSASEPDLAIPQAAAVKSQAERSQRERKRENTQSNPKVHKNPIAGPVNPLIDVAGLARPSAAAHDPMMGQWRHGH